MGLCVLFAIRCARLYGLLFLMCVVCLCGRFCSFLCLCVLFVVHCVMSSGVFVFVCVL